MARRKAPNAQSKPDRHLIERNGITPYLKAFMDWSAMTGYTEQTIRTRKIDVGYFIRWCDERGLNSPQEITTPILERYRRHLYYTRKANGEPLSLRAQHSRLTRLKAFFKWLAKEHHILYNPASELELPRHHRSLPQQLLSIEEIDTIFNQALIHGDLGLRDRAIMETLYSKHPEYGQPMVHNRLSDAIKKHILAAGIDKPGACHIFRHSMATHMLDTGEGNSNAEGGQRKKQGQRH